MMIWIDLQLILPRYEHKLAEHGGGATQDEAVKKTESLALRVISERI